MTLNPFFLQGSTNEKFLVQDIINEQLKIYGIEIYYLPRKIFKTDNIIKEIGHNNFELNILGFSQGGATACRWVFSSKIEVKNLILWAGDIPKDTLIENNKSKWSSINTHLVMGQQDPLINDKMKAKFLNLVKEYKLDYKLTMYDGDHRIYPSGRRT